MKTSLSLRGAVARLLGFGLLFAVTLSPCGAASAEDASHSGGERSSAASGAASPGAGRAEPLSEKALRLGEMYRDPLCGQIIVTCLVNGVPARLMMDTGATHTVLDRKFVDEVLKAEYVDTSKMQITGNAEEKPGIIVGDLQAGGTRFRGMMLVVMDLSGVNAMQSKPLAGILGMDAMSRLSFIMDFRAERFSWGAFHDMSPFVPLEGRRDEAGRLFVTVRSGEKSFPLLLDTGSSVTTLLPEQWAPGAAHMEDVKIADVNGPRTIRAGVGRQGALQLTPDVRTWNFSPQLLPAEADPGLLGMDALKMNVLVHKPDAQGRSCFYIGPVGVDWPVRRPGAQQPARPAQSPQPTDR